MGRGSHPSREEWHAYLFRQLEEARFRELSAHLEVCRPCRELAAAEPVPYHTFGRPLIPIFPVLPDRVKAEAKPLTALLLERGLLKIGIHWTQEAYLYQLLTFVKIELKRTGHSQASISGSIFCSDLPPARTGTSFLLDAPVYGKDHGWIEPAQNSPVILSGLTTEWMALGVEPDVVLSSEGQCRAEHRYVPFMEMLHAFFRAGSETQRGYLWLNAFGCDLPTHCPGAVEAPFLPLRSPEDYSLLPWRTAPSQYMLRAALSGMMENREREVRAAFDALSASYSPPVLDPLCRRFEARMKLLHASA